MPFIVFIKHLKSLHSSFIFLYFSVVVLKFVAFLTEFGYGRGSDSDFFDFEGKNFDFDIFMKILLGIFPDFGLHNIIDGLKVVASGLK